MLKRIQLQLSPHPIVKFQPIEHKMFKTSPKCVNAKSQVWEVWSEISTRNIEDHGCLVITSFLICIMYAGDTSTTMTVGI